MQPVLSLDVLYGSEALIINLLYVAQPIKSAYCFVD